MFSPGRKASLKPEKTFFEKFKHFKDEVFMSSI